jgi:hypothetical protein
MHAKSMSAALVASLICSTPAFAAYTQATSDPVYIHSIYQNEYGSPFVYFQTTVNPVCGGMYLYNVTLSPPNEELRKNKMAMALSAKLAEKRVVLEYFYDAGISGWAACYINGITIVD